MGLGAKSLVICDSGDADIDVFSHRRAIEFVEHYHLAPQFCSFVLKINLTQLIWDNFNIQDDTVV